MNVGLLHWAFPPTTGGTESHLADLAPCLTDAGCTVTVITGESNPIRSSGYDVVTVPLLNLDVIRRGHGLASRYREGLKRALGQLVEERELDVVHGHNLHHFAKEPALVLEQLRLEGGLKLHHTFHETWPDILHDEPVYRNWNGNYAISRFVQEQCAERIGFRPLLLRNGIDTDRFKSTRQAFFWGDMPTILHPARLLPWKGVHLSIRMLARLRAQGFEVKLILTDTPQIADWNQELEPYREEILNLIAALNVAEWVELKPTHFKDMPTLYDKADVVIYPTVGDEPFGLVPLEAMSSERPIVASRSGGIPESVLDGETGFLIDRGDVDAMVEAVRRLLLDPALSRRLGARGRTRVLESFNLKDYVATLYDCYSDRLPLTPAQ